MKMNDAPFGVFIGIIVFIVGSSGLTVGHYAVESWGVWYFFMFVVAVLSFVAVAMRDGG